MNGLTAANVDALIDAIKQAQNRFAEENKSETAFALSDIVFAIDQLRKRNNATQTSRPDRIGDECWYGTWVTGKGWSWHRGILRAWVPGDCPAVVEDVETKKVDCYSMIAFSTEAPA